MHHLSRLPLLKQLMIHVSLAFGGDSKSDVEDAIIAYLSSGHSLRHFALFSHAHPLKTSTSEKHCHSCSPRVREAVRQLLED